MPTADRPPLDRIELRPIGHVRGGWYQQADAAVPAPPTTDPSREDP
jgi:hypothetical protein